MSPPPPVACTVAGSDPSAGAGIQADLKAFAACGVYGATVVTAVTVQSTLGVGAVHPVPAAIVAEQIDAVAGDLAPAAWKTGMLGGAELVATVAARLRHHGALNIVVDPVMRSTSGRPLLSAGGVAALRSTLLPLATVLTPNLEEAAALLRRPVADLAGAREAARALCALGPRVVVVTGSGSAFCAGADVREFQGRQGAVEEIRTEYERILTGLRTMPKPTIAAVNGVAAGIGVSVALCCDLRYAVPMALPSFQTGSFPT